MAKGIYKKWLEDDNLILLQGWKRNGLTDEQIAKNIGINVRTLDKWKAKYGRIGQALKIGHEQANYAVEGKLLKKALSGNTTAMIFWLKNNWRDKYNDSELSPEERKLAVARMKKLEAETKNVQLRNKSLEENGADVEEALDRIMDKLVNESDKKD
ncbi:small terminase subunit [Limosilactobacillus reuteri]|uniref:small terminase subunit n=1 Tax=Limosilactobacillus reuteri TaxID=1598 RepID=UPI001E34C818|nr:small terminase subunit [Limosilactobacillus reuteri]MCC4383561.1 small terminase subunit [Limosilactobacillus reuteri]MCC4420356.1 small terminase subunit [Limosilactobacillus reuteri]MCC4421772.1 small terminase subunit [Limosilactobacillus reuteri]MCC4421990.1 small terminase subunit [Limosilactobacillus reuteri]MCC4422830.1 small terminase subunit [Limosilactobacillus reuteri]